MNRKDIILEQKTLELDQLGSVRCVLLKEHRPLKEAELVKALEWLKRLLMRAGDNELGPLMDQVIFFQKQLNKIEAPLSFDIKTHWYVAIDVCRHLKLSCHRKFLRKWLKQDMLKKAMVLCSDGKLHMALLVNGEGVDRLITVSKQENAAQWDMLPENGPCPTAGHAVVKAVQNDGKQTVKALSKALEQKKAENKALSRRIALLEAENKGLKHKAGLFEDIRGFVERSA